MSRAGYSDDWDGDNWELIRWRGAVARSIGGKRGQKLLRELRDALDAMPEKRLIAEDLVNEEGEVCALGCVGRVRGIDMKAIDPEDYDQVASAFGVAPALVREIENENDEFGSTPEARWVWMRKWVDRHIAKEPADAQA